MLGCALPVLQPAMVDQVQAALLPKGVLLAWKNSRREAQPRVWKAAGRAGGETAFAVGTPRKFSIVQKG